MYVSLLWNEAGFESLCCHHAGVSQCVCVWGGGLEIDRSVDESLIELEPRGHKNYTQDGDFPAVEGYKKDYVHE